MSIRKRTRSECTTHTDPAESARFVRFVVGAIIRLIVTVLIGLVVWHFTDLGIAVAVALLVLAFLQGERPDRR